MHLRTLLSNKPNDLSSAMDSTQVSQVFYTSAVCFPCNQF
jgi:hypothetical protein